MIQTIVQPLANRVAGLEHSSSVQPSIEGWNSDSNPRSNAGFMFPPPPLPPSTTTLNASTPVHYDLAPPPTGAIHTSHEELLKQVQEHAGRHGYAVIKLRSKASKKNVLRKIWLACDRGRKKRDPHGQLRVHRNSRTNECPFSATMTRPSGAEPDDGQWTLEVLNGTHNHPGSPPSDHPSLRKLAMTTERQEMILAEVRKNQKASTIAAGLRRLEDGSNSPILTVRDVYNETARIRRGARGSLDGT